MNILHDNKFKNVDKYPYQLGGSLKGHFLVHNVPRSAKHKMSVKCKRSITTEGNLEKNVQFENQNITTKRNPWEYVGIWKQRNEV